MSNFIQSIRPVGNPIPTTIDSDVDTSFIPFATSFYHSGTAALAAAILAVRKLKVNISNPEIIVPAYGCPDLISAVVFAGAMPVLIDLEEDSPYLSLERLVHAINENTIAVVAIRFFGLSERFDQLTDIAKKHNLILIEDSAQGFPATEPASYWQGDFIILSFGRGKPVNLLGGGAVLSRDSTLRNLLPEPHQLQCTLFQKIKYELKILAYNQSVKPLFYGMLSRFPMLNIGETIYKPLLKIEGFADCIMAHLHTNIHAYHSRKPILNEYASLLGACNKDLIIDLPSELNHNMLQPLLRYPILIRDKLSRDQTYERLKGFGASLMYKVALYKIPNIEVLSRSSHVDYPNANRFAHMLLTLPTHIAVNKQILREIGRVLKSL